MVLVLFLSVTSGHTARELVREAISELEGRKSWDGDFQAPRCFQVTGMYELIGNWDLAVFIEAETNAPKKAAHLLRREIMIRAQRRPFPPVHEKGGQFGRFQVVNVNRQQPSLDPNDASPVQRTQFEDGRDYERHEKTRTFVVVDASPVEEYDATPSMSKVLGSMHQAVRGEAGSGDGVECVYVGTDQSIIELMSERPGAADIARFNRVIEPVLAERAIQKYTLLCYEYDEARFGWGAAHR